MAHFAKLGINSKVISVINFDNNRMLNADNVEDETVAINALEAETGWPLWKQTSYNTKEGKYYTIDENNKHVLASEADQSKAFRKNYAGIGFTYDEDRDAFIPPKPYSNYVLDETSCTWKAPVDMPTVEQRTWTDGEGNTRGLPADWNDDLIRWESYKDAQKVYWDPDTSTWINAT
jgi:hypothetical protein